MNRSSTYKFTVESINDPRIAQLRAAIKLENAVGRIVGRIVGDRVEFPEFRKQVCVRPRLGKGNPFAPLYRRGGPLYRSSSQDIRPEHGTRFDVYVHKVYRQCMS